MKLRRILQPNYIISFCLILGGLAGLVSNASLFITIPLVAIGVLGSLYELARSNANEREADYILEAQAKLFASAGIGNIYTARFKTELYKTGSCKNASEILTKALEINPNDKDAISMLSMTYALNLSFHKWVGDKENNRFKETFSYAKKLAERGTILFPNESIFHETLGVLLDVEEKHQEARKEFFHSGKLRADPFWRLSLSTSWLMSGKPEEAVEEVKKAIDEGAKAWIVDFYYGRALRDMGDYEKAEVYLLSAFKTRGWHPELLDELMQYYFFQTKLFKSAKFSAAKGLLFLSGGRFKGLVFLAIALGIFSKAIHCTLSKYLWPFFRRIPWLCKIHFLLTPEEPEFTISATLIKDGHYKAAENLLRKVCEIGPDEGRLFSNLAICLARQGKKEEALSACDRAIELEPENEAFRHNRKSFELGCIIKGKVIDVSQ